MPWDGPAAIAFTDGLHRPSDRNGLPPARYMVTPDGWSWRRAGVLPVEEAHRAKWPAAGKMLLIDLEEKRIIGDDEIKATLAKALP